MTNIFVCVMIDEANRAQHTGSRKGEQVFYKGLDPETGLITDAKLYERSRRMRKVWYWRKRRKAHGPYEPEPFLSPPHHLVPKEELAKHEA